MRKEPTRFEAILWEELRGRKLCGLKFRRQHPIQINSLNGRYEFFIADFCCISRSLIVELDGEIHDKQKGYDFARDKCLEELGFRILRVPNKMVEDQMNKVLDLIRST